MMRAGAVLLSSCALFAPSAAIGLDDAAALVAWRGAAVAELEAEKPKKPEKFVWGPVMFSDLNMVSAIDKAIISAYRQPNVVEFTRRYPNKAAQRTTNEISVDWKFGKVEAGSKLSVAFPQGCSVNEDGTKNCETDFEKQTEASRVNLALATPLTQDSVIRFNYHVEAGFFKHSDMIKCAVCGKPCEGTIAARKFSIAMPPCPVPIGTWVFTLPVPEATNAREVPDYTLFVHGNILRPDGDVAADFSANVAMK